MGERIVVGLGNPGSAYAGSRHNVGFMVVHRLAQRWAIAFAAEQDGLVVGQGPVAGIPVRLVQPREFMNVSGQTLRKLPGAWQADDLIVVYDDLDLPAGRLRVRHDGGAGGHRGVASLIAAFGAGFDRVRIGVGRPAAMQDPAEYVLAPMTDPELKMMGEVVERASDAVECLLVDGLNQAMSRFNVRQPDLADDTTSADDTISDVARRSPCGDTRH